MMMMTNRPTVRYLLGVGQPPLAYELHILQVTQVTQVAQGH